MESVVELIIGIIVEKQEKQEGGDSYEHEGVGWLIQSVGIYAPFHKPSQL